MRANVKSSRSQLVDRHRQLVEVLAPRRHEERGVRTLRVTTDDALREQTAADLIADVATPVVLQRNVQRPAVGRVQILMAIAHRFDLLHFRTWAHGQHLMRKTEADVGPRVVAHDPVADGRVDGVQLVATRPRRIEHATDARHKHL